MKSSDTSIILAFLLGCILLPGTGCSTQSRASSTTKNNVTASAKTNSSNASVKSKAPEAKNKVTKVIFVGQKDCCDCTKARIKSTWGALQAALAGTKGVEVERFDVDVDEARADKLDKLGRIMVIPGMYLLDSNGKLVKFFQGEVTVDQISKAL